MEQKLTAEVRTGTGKGPARQARMQGGTGIGDLKIDSMPDGRSKFTTDVLKGPAAAPPPACRAHARGYRPRSRS